MNTRPEGAWTIPVPAETGLPVAERRSNVDKAGSTFAASWEEAEAPLEWSGIDQPRDGNRGRSVYCHRPFE